MGSIPARAGEPAAAGPVSGITRVYPRACGGTSCRRARERDHQGLSPRVRGNLSRFLSKKAPPRSIPARAGEPRWPSKNARPERVYPRACGGTESPAPHLRKTIGLSPRVRGNRAGCPLPVPNPRSIPARAGEPVTAVIPMILSRVYPRACGGTRHASNASEASSGLSPRVRGNPHRGQFFRSHQRSIPARAGEPSCR